MPKPPARSERLVAGSIRAGRTTSDLGGTLTTSVGDQLAREIARSAVVSSDPFILGGFRDEVPKSRN
ncbi:MAG: hypothetical protein R2862_11310 [Thermoanaerobaculia bacterium]